MQDHKEQKVVLRKREKKDGGNAQLRQGGFKR